MGETKKSSLFPGLLLIFIGLALLLNKLMPEIMRWHFIYPLILMGLGIWFILLNTNRQDKGAVFPGTILFLVGLFFFLRNFRILHHYYYVWDVWPIFIIIIGLGFVALFISKPSDWGPLVPGGLFLFFGIFYLLKINGYIDWEIWYLISQYWPVILILLGAGIIYESLRRR